MQIVLIVICLAILVAIFYKVVTSYDAKRENLLKMALRGDVEGSVLRQKGKEHVYAIIYRERKGDLNAVRIQATNELEARFIFVKETLESTFRIQSIKKL